MKFLCSHCKAKYQIADEKVAGRTLRMTCRSCQQEIMIRGDLPVPPAPAPIAVPVPAPAPAAAPAPPVRRPTPAALSPLAADFQRQVVASVHAPPLPAPIDEWHVGINDVPVGPMRREEVARKLASGAVHPDSLAWREGLDDWLPIRNIPELAVLCAPGMSLSPPPLHSPAQRTELGPIGGRAGAQPAYAMEDWAQVAPVAPVAEPSPSQQISSNPMLGSAPEVERRSGMPSISVIFALAAGFALLTAVVAIFGARWLQGGPQPAPVAVNTDKPAAAAPAAPAPQAAAPAAAAPQPAQGDVPEMVIGLDDVQQNDSRGTTRPRTPSGTAAAGKQPPKKELTAEQKAMLERMGGGDAPSNLNIGSGAQVGGAPVKGTGGPLTQAAISAVVLRGRVNLQRCYETALRGAGSTDTVRMDVELTITAAGNATNVKTSGQGLPGMAQCIERTVKMWRFPSSSDATATKFPLVFQPGS
jgi:predicted Zn finger-like uncharacterized protein